MRQLTIFVLLSACGISAASEVAAQAVRQRVAIDTAHAVAFEVAPIVGGNGLPLIRYAVAAVLIVAALGWLGRARAARDDSWLREP